MSDTPIRLLHEMLLAAASRSPSKVALIAEGIPHTYEQLLQTAARLAYALRERSLQRGDRVAIYMNNSLECIASIYGISMAGGAFMVINPQTKQDKLEYILRDSEAVILLTESRLARVFVPALAGVTTLRAVLCAGQVPSSPTPIESLDAVIRESAPMLQPVTLISLDLAALIYTSGSTGHPKGVMMTHQAMVFTAESLSQYLRLSSDERILNVLPFAFDYGLYQLILAIRHAATLVLERSFTYPAQVMQRMQEHQVTVFPGVPTIYAMLVDMHRHKPLCFASVRRVTCTAADLPASMLPELQEIFPNALIFKMYGLTECKRVCYIEPEELTKRPTSVGKAIPGVETFILNEQGLPAAPNEVGILYVRGANVMLGYWKQPERTAEMLKTGRYPGESVLCTQDRFKADEDGYLYFVGRTDDVIKTRGEKVSPVEVENALYAIVGIKEAAVIGVPDELLGQKIRAYVALGPTATLTERDIIGRCAATLENFMVPQEVVLLPELPKTDTGKIRKKDLATLATRADDS